MATVNYTETEVTKGVIKVAWSGISTGDTITAYSPKWGWPLGGSVQFTGTFGGATVVLEGSNDGTNYETVKDTLGGDISLTAAGLKEFSSSVLNIRPSISGGTGDSVTVTMVLRG